MHFRIPDHIRYRAVHGEVMILDAQTDRYLGLNATGAVVWDVLAAGGSIATAVETVIGLFPASSARARDDVMALVNDLIEHNVLEPIPT